MTKRTYWIPGILLLAALIVGSWALLSRATKEEVVVQEVITKRITYFCDAGSIDATYLEHGVRLQLSDGREFSLPFASSSGAYEDKDVVFTDEGTIGFREPNTLISNCIAGYASGSLGMQTFTDEAKTFAISYPSEATILGGQSVSAAPVAMMKTMSMTAASVASPQTLIAEVVIPQSFASSTNFQDAVLMLISQSEPQDIANCVLGGTPVVMKGITWKKYQEAQGTAYKTVYKNQCYTLRYTIHEMEIGKPYDKKKIVDVLEDMVASFEFIPTEDEVADMHVRELVTVFGSKLKMVPLTAEREILRQAMEQNYAPYISTELLDAWLANPTRALGRVTSSPAPDRIEINSVEKISNTEYVVTGTVVDTVQTRDVATSSVSLEIHSLNGLWEIYGVSF